MSEKLFVIGLDAADPNLLEGWIAEGKLPFFAKLMKEAVYTRLECVPPTFSPVEWSSILTGANPGKHGIFGFIKPVDGGRQIKILNRTDRKMAAFYEVLADAGRRVGMINMVMTYPATEINGFMIAGMETPDLTSPGIAYPAGLIQELNDIGCDYQIGPGISGSIMAGKVDEAVDALHRVMEARYTATKYLMQQYNCDVMVVLFSQIDNCGHYFWRYYDKQHADYQAADGQRYGDVMLGLYQRHEEIVQEMMAEHPDATFVICSDHGMGYNYEARYYLKELFGRLDWYTSAQETQARFSPQRLAAKQAKQLYWAMYKRFPFSYKQRLAQMFPFIRSRVESMISDVGWGMTKVYSNDDFFSIVINRENREGEPFFASEKEFQDFRNELVETLYGLEELSSGERLVDKVHLREDIYHGPFVDDAPDLVIDWADVRLREGVRFGETTIRKDEIEKDALQEILTGEHRSEGILFLKGDMFREGTELHGNSVLDIAPTVLHICGQPISTAVDGKVLVDAFAESFLTAHPVQFTDDDLQVAEEEFTYSEAESQEVQDRLRSLGYIE